MIEKLEKLGITKAIQLSRYFQKHYRTGKMADGREKLLNEIIEATNWLPENSVISHRWYVLKNKLNEYPKCDVCGNSIVWNPNTSDDVKNTVCGKSCAALRRQQEHKNIYSNAAKKGWKSKDKRIVCEKISKALSNKTPDERKIINEKRISTLVERGLYIRPENMEEFKEYSRKTRILTHEQKVNDMENSQKRGKAGKDGAYHLDHIISVKEGYLRNIPPELIADKRNLRFIPWEENYKKKCKFEADYLDLLPDDYLFELSEYFNEIII